MSIKETLKNLLMGYPEEFDDDEDYYEEENNDLQPVNGEKAGSFMSRFSKDKKIVSFDEGRSGVSHTSQATVMISRPTSFKDGANIVDSLKSGKIVIVDLKDIKHSSENSLTQKDEYERQNELLNYLGGAIYAIEGDFKKLSSTVFIFVPMSVDIDSDLTSTEKKEHSLPWISSL